MNKSKITLFLAFILISGTITAFFPSSSFITEIHALSDYGLDNNYKKSKDNSKSISKNKIKCINGNININGINSGDVNIGNKGKVAPTASAEEGYSGAYSSGSGVYYGKGYDNKKDKDFDCIINNDNENRQITQQPITQLPPSPPPPPPIEGATLSINKEWFVCNNDNIDCTIEIPGQQISFQGPNSGMYTECTSDVDCPFANDAGFNIEITGTSSTPNTIPAQVNTLQQVEIGAGPFEVSEELFSDELVPNASFDVENVPVGQDIQIFAPFSLPIIVFDEAGQRVFTANTGSDSVSIIDLANSNTVTNVSLTPSGGDDPIAIAFDEAGQRVFTANAGSDSVSIIDLTDNSVTNVPLTPSGGDSPFAIAFDEAGQRVFTANFFSDSVSIIDLTDNSVTNIPLTPSGGDSPFAIAFDEAGQRVFTANTGSDSVSIIEQPTIEEICQDSGFDTGDIRTFVSNGQTIQQITCVNFVGECSGEIDDGETRECTVQNYAVRVLNVSDENGIVTSSNTQQQQLQQRTNNIITTTTSNNDDTILKSLIQLKEQKLAEEQKIQKSIVMSPPSLP